MSKLLPGTGSIYTGRFIKFRINSLKSSQVEDHIKSPYSDPEAHNHQGRFGPGSAGEPTWSLDTYPGQETIHQTEIRVVYPSPEHKEGYPYRNAGEKVNGSEENDSFQTLVHN